MVEAEGGRLSHVKVGALLIVLRYPPPLIIQVHGALYFMLRDDPALLRAFLRAHVSLSPSDPIPFFGLAGTAHEAISKEWASHSSPSSLSTSTTTARDGC
jgi:lactam utilization protein B